MKKTYVGIAKTGKFFSIFIQIFKEQDYKIQIEFGKHWCTFFEYPSDWKIKGYNIYEGYGVFFDVKIMWLRVGIYFRPIMKKQSS